MRQQQLEIEVKELLELIKELRKTITIRDATIASQANTMTQMVKAQDNRAEFKPFLFHRNAAMDRAKANNYSGQ
jgi:hypothetical protein